MNDTLPFAGLRVLALEQAVAGPFCTRQFADLGADVIKVEHPVGGDVARRYDGAMQGLSAYFAWLNRGKRSVTLDLKGTDGRATMLALVDGCDVFVHNLAAGAIERLGLDYDTVAARNPRAIWVRISGYGPDGPYRERKAYDMLIQAEAGIVSVTGSPDTPAKAGVSIADIGSGHYAFSSATAALYRRERTGRGARIDISMLECMTEWMMPPLYVHLGGGSAPQRTGLRHNMIVPYGVYACADGQVLFAVQNDAEFGRLCEGVLASPTLARDPRFSVNAARLAHRDALESLIEGTLSALSVTDVIARLERSGIANAVVNDVAGVASHPQLAARRRWRDVESPVGAIPALVPPHNIIDAPPVMGPIPRLGEHAPTWGHRTNDEHAPLVVLPAAPR
ncbi:MAG: CoA transferase [Gemmatimonadaceae bacterium]|nr:CoA transferase [Gemmatimonadaceae bacterium]